MTTRKLTGGFTGYRAAVADAFSRNMHNPSVVYSDREGFTVQSTLVPLDDDEVRVHEASYCADGGEPSMSGSRREYATVRARLVAWLDARAAGKSRRAADEAADDAEMEIEYAAQH